MDVDDVFKEVGELGLEQWKYVLILSVIRLNMAQHFFQYTFVRRDLPYTCNSNNGTSSLEEFNVGDEGNFTCPSNCGQIEFNTTEESSLTSEWKLVCDDAWMGPLTFTCLSVGWTVGSFLGVAADKFGRKIVLFLCLLVMTLANQVGGMVTGFYFYCATRTIVGLCIGGMNVCLSTLSNELVGSSRRGVVAVLFAMGWALGIALLALCAYLLPHWRHLMYAVTGCSAPLLLLYLVLPESPRWLLAHGRVEEATNILKKIAQGNGKPLKDKLVLQVPEESSPEKQHENKQSLLLSFFKQQRLVFMFLCLTYSGSVVFLLSFGLIFLSGTASSNLYLGTAIGGLIEFPGDLLAALVMVYFGRKRVVAAFMICCGCCLIVVTFAPLPYWGTTAFVLAGKMLISGSAAIYFLHLNECFPTSLRATCSGIVFFLGQIISSFCPYFLLLDNLYHNLHYLVFGCMAVLAGALNMLLLPETAGRKLPETVEDLLEFFRPLPKDRDDKSDLQLKSCSI